ncbi:MAG: tyrosine-type recombinase/integrase [Phycisphaerales bacterium]
MLDTVPAHALSVQALQRLYLAHAEVYYRRRSGEPTREHLNVRAVLDRFARHVGPSMPADRMNRHQVRAWLDQLAAEQLTRSYINACLARLRRVVRWAVDLDYLPASIDSELRCVRPLPAHRSAAREPQPVQAAPLDHVRQVLPFLPRLARDVVQLLMLTGARVGELLDAPNSALHVDRAGARLILAQHKNAHRNRSRVIPLNAAALAIIERHARPLCPIDPILAPPRRGSRRYSPDALRNAITRACRRAGVAPFTPHQVRHAVAAHVRDARGLDAACALLGHAHVSMTEHYAPLAFEHARQGAEVLQ